MSETQIPSTMIDLRPLIDLRADIEAMSLRLLAGEPVSEDEYRAVLDRHDRDARAIVDGIIATFTPCVDERTTCNRIRDGLTLAADRISGMWGLSAMWDEANADRWAHATTMRLLDAKRREGASMASLWDLYRECENDLSPDARHDVAAWLRSLEG